MLLDEFLPDTGILNRIKGEESIWFNEDKIEVLIHVFGDACQYFKRRKLFPEQGILKEMDSGDLLITCRVASKNQLFPLVRYWLPNIKIHTPVDWNIDFISELDKYVNTVSL